MVVTSFLVEDERAQHPFPIWAREEQCQCGKPAAHKIEEVPFGAYPPLSSYLCCRCFRRMVGNCRKFPYAEAAG